MLIKLTNELWVNANQIFSIRTRDLETADGMIYHLYVSSNGTTEETVTVVLKSTQQRQILIDEIEQALKLR